MNLGYKHRTIDLCAKIVWFSSCDMKQNQVGLRGYR